MELLNKNKSIEEKKDATSLREALNRFVDDSYTLEDMALILDSVRDDENSHVFCEIFKRVENESSSITPPKTEEGKKVYRKEADRIYAEYERKRKMLSMPVPSRNIGRLRKIWYAAAAVLLLGMLIPAVHYLMKPNAEQAVIQYVEAVSARGEIKTIFLPDQTKVTLNAESRLKYPAKFCDERSVELLGEALFEVTADSERPFTVATSDMNVRVLGTVFGVKAYPDDGSSSVSVASGKVEVDLPGAKVLLERNHQLKMDMTTGNFEKLTIDVDRYLSWTDGTLYFHRTPIREVVNMFNRHFPQMDIDLAEGEYANLITGELDGKRMETVFSFIIYTTGLKSKKAGNKIILYQP